MIKILFVTHSLGSGGAEKVFSLIMNNLDRTKFSIDCLLLNRVTHEVVLEPDIHLTELKSTFFLKSIVKVSSYIRKSKPDIVLGTVAPVNILLMVVKLLSILDHSRPIYVLRESTVLSEFQKLKGAKNRILIRMVSWFYPFYDKIICQSNDIKNDLHRSFHISKSKLVLINNPVMFNSIVEVDNSIDGKDLKFVTVGRLRQEKGVERLLQIIAKYKTVAIKPFKYYILGDGDVENTSKAKKLVKRLSISENVELVGHFNNPVEFIKDADLFLQGSFFEGFPNAVLEACSVGVPVIAFDVPGGTKEIIRHGKNGILVDDGKLDDYVNYLTRIDSFEFDRKSIVQDIQDRFSIKVIMSEYEQLFESIVPRAHIIND